MILRRWHFSAHQKLTLPARRSMATFNVLTATVSDLEKALGDGSVTSAALVSEYLCQIAAYNGYLHAVISTMPTNLALDLARSLDRERAQGRVRGPLHGIPIVVKDNIATDPSLGMETTAGTYALVGSRVRDSAPLVKQLQDAGAIILAKGNLSELGNYRGFRMPAGWSAVGGLTQSPYVAGGKKWDDGFGGHTSTGGSSSGPCVAVAAGFAPASIGTDTNGSILMPATRNDVYAMKPTLGLVSPQGICPICLEFDSAGPIARCARDIALLMDVLVDPDKVHHRPAGGYISRLTQSFDGIRIGVLNPKEWHLPEVVAVPNEEAERQQDDEIANAYERLRSIGVEVKEVEIASLEGLDVDGMSQIQRVMNSSFRKDFEAYLRDLEVSRARTLEDVMQVMKENAALEFPPESPNMKRLETAAAFILSEEARKAAVDDMRDFGRRRAIDKCLQDYGVDVILGPADSEIDDFYSAAGYPMAVLPLSYFNFNGRPFGVCALASAYQEALLIQLMSAWEKVFNTKRKLPAYLKDGQVDLHGHA